MNKDHYYVLHFPVVVCFCWWVVIKAFFYLRAFGFYKQTKLARSPEKSWMAAFSDVLSSVQRKNTAPAKQVKFASQPVMISKNAATLATSTIIAGELPPTIDTKAILQSIPNTSSSINPIPSLQSPRKSSTSSKVKGTIPVTDFSDPNKIKNVLVSMPSTAGEGSSDHTYARENPGSSLDNTSSDDSSSSSDENDPVEIRQIKTTPVNPVKPTQTTSTGKGRGRPRKQPLPESGGNTVSSEVTPQLRSILKTAPASASAVTYEKVKRRGRGCGNCAGCLREDCGNCCYCLDKPKFGGPGKKKQRCALRVCAHFKSTSVRNLAQSKSALAEAAKVLSNVSNTTPSDSKLNPLTSIRAAAQQTLSALDTSLAMGATPTSRGPPAATPTSRTSKQALSTGGGAGGPDDLIKCVLCGRERKISMSRSKKFCSSKCLKDWEILNPGKNPDTAEPSETNINIPMLLQATLADRSEKPMPRLLKNLQIDMALPGERHHDPTSPATAELLDVTPLISSLAGGVSTSPPSLGIKRSGQQDVGTTPTKKLKQSVAIMTSPVTSPVVTTAPPTGAITNPAARIPGSTSKKGKLNPAEVSRWSISDVVKYFESTGECSHIATVFNEQEVDGEALLLLSHDSLVKCLGMKLGPALKVMTHVDKLKSQANSSF